MLRGWSRFGAVAGLLLAIANHLGRRTWWAYRRSGRPLSAPRVAVVQPRARETRPYVPRLTPDWQPLAAQALPVRASGLAILPHGEVLPVVWIDARGRPDVNDLPRVLRLEARHPAALLSATQWLYEATTGRVVLAITLIEPALSTWALRFELPRDRAWLQRVAAAAHLVIALDAPPAAAAQAATVVAWHALPTQTINLPLTTTAQLAAILALPA